MKKNLFIVIALVGALVVPTVARAHENDKTVMGSVSSINGNNLMVKTADDKSVMVMVDAKTKITKGTAKLKVAELKVGDRVVASGPEDKGMIMAETVKIGAVAPAKSLAKKYEARRSIRRRVTLSDRPGGVTPLSAASSVRMGRTGEGRRA